MSTVPIFSLSEKACVQGCVMGSSAMYYSTTAAKLSQCVSLLTVARPSS